MYVEVLAHKALREDLNAVGLAISKLQNDRFVNFNNSTSGEYFGEVAYSVFVALRSLGLQPRMYVNTINIQISL